MSKEIYTFWLTLFLVVGAFYMVPVTSMAQDSTQTESEIEVEVETETEEEEYEDDDGDDEDDYDEDDDIEEEIEIEEEEEMKVKKHYDMDIKFLLGRGIAKGFSDGKFWASREITRGEFSTILTNSLSGVMIPEEVINTCKDRVEAGEVIFDDVPLDAVHAIGICVVKEFGIVKGVGDGSEFRPDELITFDQAAKMVIRALTDIDIPEDADLSEYVDEIKALGLMPPTARDNRQSPLIRGEMAFWIHKLLIEFKHMRHEYYKSQRAGFMNLENLISGEEAEQIAKDALGEPDATVYRVRLRPYDNKLAYHIKFETQIVFVDAVSGEVLDTKEVNADNPEEAGFVPNRKIKEKIRIRAKIKRKRMIERNGEEVFEIETEDGETVVVDVETGEEV